MPQLRRRPRSRAIPPLVLLAPILCAALAMAEVAAPARSGGDESDREVLALRAEIARHPGDAKLWAALVASEVWSIPRRDAAAAVAAGAAPQAAGDVGARMRAAGERVCREWMQAMPGDAGPHLALLQWSPPEERSGRLAALLERFPDSAAVVEARAQDLRVHGDYGAAGQLVDAFLARHAEDPEAWRLAYSHRLAEGDAARARELLDGWRERAPGDPGALRAWFDRELAGRDAEGAKALAGEVAERLRPVAGAGAVCARLGERAELLPIAADCYRRLLTAPAGEAGAPRPGAPLDDTAALVSGYGQIAAQLGDRAGLDAALAALPEAERPAALVSAAFGLTRAGRCEAALAVAGGLPRMAFGGEHLSDLARALQPCDAAPATAALLLELAAAAPPEALHSLAAQGTSMSSRLPVDRWEALLARRLAERPSETALWAALDAAYEQNGQTAARIAHLQAWLAAQPAYQGTARPLSLANLLASRGRADEAIAVLAAACGAEGGATDAPLNERLAALYVASGRPEQAAEVARRLVALGGEQPASAHGHLLLARLATLRGAAGEADAEYSRFFAAAPAGEAAAAGDELLAFLARRGDAASVAAFAERLHAASPPGSGPGDRDEFVAGKLLGAGFAAAALPYLDRALARSPQRAFLFEQLARAAEEAKLPEREETALRALVALDPKDSSRWSRLAELMLRRGQADRAVAVATEAMRTVPKVTGDLELVLGRAELARNDPVAAIPVLRQLVAEQPDNGTAYEELRRAYRMLGEKE